MKRVNFKKIATLLIFGFTFLLLPYINKVKAQLPVPVMNCVSVEEDGSLTVAWNFNPGDPFDGFRIYYKPVGSTLPIPYAEYINTLTSGVIPVTDAQTIPYEVFMVTFKVTPASTSGESNHLRSMMLTVSNSGAGSGIARLDWNRIGPGNNGIFNIYRKDDPLDPFPLTPFANTSEISYLDTITYPYCDEDNPATLYYKIEFSSGSCVASSSVSAGSFFDDNIPENPSLSLVTINSSGLAELTWTPSPTIDISGYMVGVEEGGLYLDHYYAGDVTTFIDNQSALPTYHDPCTEVVKYWVKSKDMCDNGSSDFVLQNTILLTGETESECKRKATLSWNGYINMYPPVSSYKVYRSEGGGSDIEIANIDPTVNNNYTFMDPELLVPGTNYVYHVAAINSDISKISRSCRVLLVPDPDPLYDFTLDYVTVVNNDHIDLHLNADPASLINSIEVWRSSVSGSSVEFLFSQPWDGVSPAGFTDADAEVNATSYYYSIRALDACGYEMASSNLSRSIFLRIEDIGNDRYRLSWNAYEDWGSDLIEYNVYRIADGIVESGFPVSVPSNQLTFDDFAGDLVANRTTYYVEAVRNDNTSSLSNEVLLPAEAEVIIPNAFRPDGVSPVFKPRIKNIEPGSYLFSIYNRWGQIVFSSADPSVGWNGQFNGRQASQDIYAWVITFRDLTGKEASKRGSVLLLR